MNTFPRVFFITGTDTDVGKTVVAAVLALGLQAHYWKPVQAGGSADADQAAAQTDSEFLARAGVDRSVILAEQYHLSQPLSPHLAARIDGRQISLSDFALPDLSTMNHLIIEGAGGLLVPLNDQDKVINLIVHLKIPVLLVARSALGTINHTLLSLAAMQARSIEILGVVMTGARNPENRKAIEQFGGTEVIAEIPLLADFKRETLLDCFAENFQGGRRREGENEKYDLASVYANAHGRSST